MAIFDKTTIPEEEKLFIRQTLNEINSKQEKYHKHNESLVLVFKNIKEQRKLFDISGSLSNALITNAEIPTVLASKCISQIRLCGEHIKWNLGMAKHLPTGAILIAMDGQNGKHIANAVIYISRKDITTEVNQQIINNGKKEIITRIISEVADGVLLVKEVISSMQERPVLLNRYSYLNIPSEGTSIAIKEEPEKRNRKEVLYEKNCGTENAKGYDILYDDTHTRPEDAFKYLMTGNFNNIVYPPSFLIESEIGKKFYEEKKKQRKEMTTIKKQAEEKISLKKKRNTGALEIEQLLSTAKKNLEKNK